MKFLAEYDVSGLGHCHEWFVVEARDLGDARRKARDAGLARAEESLVSDAKPLTKEVAEQYGISEDEPAMAE